MLKGEVTQVETKSPFLIRVFRLNIAAIKRNNQLGKNPFKMLKRLFLANSRLEIKTMVFIQSLAKKLEQQTYEGNKINSYCLAN